jgi:hypothetical protein
MPPGTVLCALYAHSKNDATALNGRDFGVTQAPAVPAAQPAPPHAVKRHWHDLAAIARSPYFAGIIEDRAREALAEDYAAMLADEVMVGDALSFDQLMQACAEVATLVNKATVDPAAPA